MKSLASIFGWALLVAVLAVPSFLFYNWWTKSRQQASAEMAQEPASANIFPAGEKARPAAQVPAAAAAPTAQPVQPAARPPAAARPTAQPIPQQQPTPQPLASPGALISTAVVQQVQVSTPMPPAVSVSTQIKPVSYYTPKSDRDPTLSPADYSRMKQAELQRREEERQRRQAENRRPKEVLFESRLQLQGIVGNAAIINGEMYSAGQAIYGAKILKVGANYVIGEYKGRRFRKVLK